MDRKKVSLIISDSEMDTVTISRRWNKTMFVPSETSLYHPTPASKNRLFEVLSNEVNKLYGPAIKLYPGGFEVEW